MRSRTLTVFEHDRVPVGDVGSATSLAVGEADYLESIAKLRPGFCERGHRSLRLAEYSGILSVGDRVLEVLPKIDDGASSEMCRGVVLKMLRQAEQFPHFRHLSTGHRVRHATLLDVFIATFFDTVTQIVRGGLLRQYREREEELPLVRGRIVTSRQFAAHANRVDRVACSYDDLTADNIWNRLIKLGLRTVRPWIATVDLNRQWVELMAVFDDVEDSRADMDALKRLHYGRGALRYRPSIEWVKLIINLLSPALRAGTSVAPGLLFDLNLLFESAVASVLGCHVPAGLTLDVQDSTRNLAKVCDTGGREAFALRPDLVLRHGKRTLAIGDTKWKRLELRGGFLRPKEVDIYQMHAYAAAFECQNVALIYPWHEGLAGSKETAFELPRVGTTSPVVTIVCVDVGQEHMAIMRGSRATWIGAMFKR
ncbi:MAG: hypothetical protein ABI625_15500 [bacterium]